MDVFLIVMIYLFTVNDMLFFFHVTFFFFFRSKMSKLIESAKSIALQTAVVGQTDNAISVEALKKFSEVSLHKHLALLHYLIV